MGELTVTLFVLLLINILSIATGYLWALAIDKEISRKLRRIQSLEDSIENRIAAQEALDEELAEIDQEEINIFNERERE